MGSDATVVYSEFLRTASAIAKQNALFRARYPSTDPLYTKVERAISGAFWDMPVQLHVFWDAMEKSCTWDEHQEFALLLEKAVRDARRGSRKTKARPRWPHPLEALGPARGLRPDGRDRSQRAHLLRERLFSL